MFRDLQRLPSVTSIVTRASGSSCNTKAALFILSYLCDLLHLYAGSEIQMRQCQIRDNGRSGVASWKGGCGLLTECDIFGNHGTAGVFLRDKSSHMCVVLTFLSLTALMLQAIRSMPD